MIKVEKPIPRKWVQPGCAFHKQMKNAGLTKFTFVDNRLKQKRLNEFLRQKAVEGICTASDDYLLEVR